MKLTKTEEIKAFKFYNTDDDEYEMVAAHSLKQAKSLIVSYYDLNNFEINKIEIKHMTKLKLEKEVGNHITKNFTKGRKMNAYEALKASYKYHSVPFIFWTTYLD